VLRLLLIFIHRNNRTEHDHTKYHARTCFPIRVGRNTQRAKRVAFRTGSCDREVVSFRSGGLAQPPSPRLLPRGMAVTLAVAHMTCVADM
jgi:hypothetical protein